MCRVTCRPTSQSCRYHHYNLPRHASTSTAVTVIWRPCQILGNYIGWPVLPCSQHCVNITTNTAKLNYPPEGLWQWVLFPPMSKQVYFSTLCNSGQHQSFETLPLVGKSISFLLLFSFESPCHLIRWCNFLICLLLFALLFLLTDCSYLWSSLLLGSSSFSSRLMWC